MKWTPDLAAAKIVADYVGTVHHEASIACSTATALKWDASFTAQNEPSGRAIAGIHDDAYKK